MKIAIDSGPLESGHSVRGVGAYTRELISELKKIKAKKAEIFAVDFAKTNLSRFDCVHYPFFHPYFPILPPQKYAKTVVTVHDLIPLIYPKQYQAGIKGRLNFWKQKSRLKNVDAVIVPSFTSKKDLIRFMDVLPEKIQVVYEGPRKIFKEISDNKILSSVKKKYKLPSSFVLYVGDVNYNKNIPGLIEACKLADKYLVICGKQARDIEDEATSLTSLRGPRDYFRYLFNIPHPELAHFTHLVNKFKSNPKILRLGFVPDGDLVTIYNLASVYVQPSFYEGFGLPVLEAFGCACPVIVGKTNALTEVAGEACLTVDSRNPSDIANKIEKIFDDSGLRARLIREGEKRVTAFSWQKTARETLDVYRSITD